MPGSEVVPGPGNVVVQRGTACLRTRTGQQAARMVVVLAGGVLAAEAPGICGRDVPGSLLHDPMHCREGTSESRS